MKFEMKARPESWLQRVKAGDMKRLRDLYRDSTSHFLSCRSRGEWRKCNIFGSGA